MSIFHIPTLEESCTRPLPFGAFLDRHPFRLRYRHADTHDVWESRAVFATNPNALTLPLTERPIVEWMIEHGRSHGTQIMWTEVQRGGPASWRRP